MDKKTLLNVLINDKQQSVKNDQAKVNEFVTELIFMPTEELNKRLEKTRKNLIKTKKAEIGSLDKQRIEVEKQLDNEIEQLEAIEL